MKRILKDPSTEIPFTGLGAFSAEFKLSREEELVKLHAALAEGDLRTIEQVCHTWRGFAVPYGFGELAILATELEAAAAAKNFSLCLELLGETEAYLSSK